MFYKRDIKISAPQPCKSSNLAKLAVAILVTLTSFTTPIYPYNLGIMLNDFTDFSELTIASVNCNSLNMSVSSKHNQCKKFTGSLNYKLISFYCPIYDSAIKTLCQPLMTVLKFFVLIRIEHITLYLTLREVKGV